MTTSYSLQVPGFGARSTWEYDDLTERLHASVLRDSEDEGGIPLVIDAVTIDQLLDRIDLATGRRCGMALLVLLLCQREVHGQPRVWLASRIRLITDQELLAAAARSDVPWVAAEARSHPLFDEPQPDESSCPTCGRPHAG